MKKIATLFAVTLSWNVLMVGATGGCGSAGATNPPNIAGFYTLTNTECPGFFDSEIEVVQDGADIIFQATHVGFIDVVGSIDDEGNIDASNENGSCEGKFVSGVATATCESSAGTCHITYTKD